MKLPGASAILPLLCILAVCRAVVALPGSALSAEDRGGLHARVERLISEQVHAGIWSHLDSLQLEIRPFVCKSLPADCEIDLEPLTERLRGTNIFRARFRRQGQTLRVLTISVFVRCWEPVAVAARDLPRGLILSTNDLALKLRETTQHSNLDLPDPNEAIGLRIERYLGRGRIVHRRMLRQVPDLNRGQEISLTVRSGGVVVSVPARLERDACLGETVPVRLVDGGKRFRARILSDGCAVVEASR